MRTYKLAHNEETFCEHCGMPLMTGDIVTYTGSLVYQSAEMFCSAECARQAHRPTVTERANKFIDSLMQGCSWDM